MKSNPIIKVSCFEIELPETTDPVKKYQFIEVSENHYRNAFTELRKFGAFRWFIKSTVNKNWTVSNTEDIDVFCKYFLRLK